MPLNDVTALLADLQDHLDHCTALLADKPQVSPSEGTKLMLEEEIRTVTEILQVLTLNRQDIEAIAAKVNAIVAYLAIVDLPHPPAPPGPI